MKKVGILSMQRINNYGSFLQAYGLKTMIESLGYETEFVDYHIEKSLIEEKTSKNRFSRNLKKGIETFTAPGSLKNKLKYIKYKQNFKNKYIKLLGISSNYNYNPELDSLVIGSDEVFNCIQSNDNVGYSLELFGKDNNARNLISYAASFGNTTLDKLKQYNKTDEIANYLKKFNSISVRDKNSYEIVKELTSISANINLDPVLMFDYKNKLNFKKNENLTEKYMIVYAYNGRITKNESTKIKQFAKEKNLKIYSIGGIQDCTDKFIDCEPFEIFNYFCNAEYIITDTFHGSIFSIVTNTDFSTLIRKSVKNSYGNEEKLSDLLCRLGLKNRISYDINETIKKLNSSIDYTDVNKIIVAERKKTMTYLKNNLSINLKCININNSNCCGCGACSKSCPVKAIDMKEDEYGFIYPNVDRKKCINCGLCEKKCNYRNKIYSLDNKQEAYAAVSKNKEILESSASGGVFSEIALSFLKKNGIVYGATFKKDERGCIVYHERIDSPSKLYLLQGSKYIQSSIMDSYEKVKDDLQSGKNVLFSGTPCQVDALKGFLNNKEYKNLFTIDIICHGVPNLKMFNDYITYEEKKYLKLIKNFIFRDKTKKMGLFYKIVFDDNSVVKRTSYNSSYYQMFLDSKIYRKNCYSCPYANLNRVSDMTIGDYWGFEIEHHQEMVEQNINTGAGISCVLVNSENGKLLLNDVKDNLTLISSTAEKIALHNHQLVSSSKAGKDINIIMDMYKDGYNYFDSYYHRKNLLKNLIKKFLRK